MYAKSAVAGTWGPADGRGLLPHSHSIEDYSGVLELAIVFQFLSIYYMIFE